MMQWQAFDRPLLKEVGLNNNFFPFDRPILPKEVKYISMSSQFEDFSCVGSKDSENFFAGDRPASPMEVRYVSSRFDGFSYVGCKDRVSRHTDGKLLKPYSAMLIVRNDGLIAKPTACGKSKFQPQTPGTIIVLNISAYHHCIRDSRIPQKESGLWVAISYEFDRKPERTVVEDKFRTLLLKG